MRAPCWYGQILARRHTDTITCPHCADGEVHVEPEKLDGTLSETKNDSSNICDSACSALSALGGKWDALKPYGSFQYHA